MKRTYEYLVFNLISVHICHSCLNFTNYNVTFNATNFEYLLHWNKHDLAPEVSFSVQYKRYGQTEWLLLHDCQNITRVYCNLTNAIVGDVEDFMENQYFGRVRALSTNCTSDWVLSKRLNPRDDTYLILPKLNYIQHMNSITILVPNPYVPIRRKDKQPVTVEDLYKGDNFEYHLNFFNPEKQDIWQKTQANRTFEVSGLSPDVEYNGNIYISIGNERKSEIQFFVVRTLPDYSMVRLIASLIAVLVTALGAGLFLLSYKYIKQQVQTPNSLVFQKSTTLPLMTLPKDRVISSCTVGFCPAIFMLNYELKHEGTSRKTLQDTSGNSQQQMYASQSHGAITQGQDAAVISSSVSSVHYGEVFDRTSNNTTYLENTTPNPGSKCSYNSEGDFQINTNSPFVDYDGDVPNAFMDNPFKNLFSSLLSKDSDSILNLMPPIGLMSSVTVRDDADFPAQMAQTEEYPPDLLSDLHCDSFGGLTSNQEEDYNLQDNFLGHGVSSYIVQCPVEKSTLDTLDRTIVYKKQCIL